MDEALRELAGQLEDISVFLDSKPGKRYSDAIGKLITKLEIAVQDAADAAAEADSDDEDSDE